MKKLALVIAATIFTANVMAEPVCPTVAEVKATQMDFVLGFNKDDSPVFSPDFNYVTAGHIHGSDANWYVMDGAFTGAHSVSEALSVGQAYIAKADDPFIMHDDSKTNLWACIYNMEFSSEDGNPKFIVAVNGSVEDLKHFSKKFK